MSHIFCHNITTYSRRRSEHNKDCNDFFILKSQPGCDWQKDCRKSDKLHNSRHNRRLGFRRSFVDIKGRSHCHKSHRSCHISNTCHRLRRDSGKWKTACRPEKSNHNSNNNRVGNNSFYVLFDTYFKDFSCEAAVADQSILVQTGKPSGLLEGTLLLSTAELTIFDVTDTYRFVFGTHWGIHEMRVKKDGSAAVLYCTDDYTTNHADDIFHALRFAFLIVAAWHDLFVLHSVSILYQGKAWLFSGSSGTGKSTHADLWMNQYQTPVLNGDLNILGIKDGMPCVYGLPWCGTSEIYTTTTYPLGGIVFLKQAPFNRVDFLSLDEQALCLVQRMISPTWTKDLVLKSLAFAEKLAPLTRIFRLNCTKDPEAAAVMKAAIDLSV